MKTLFYTQTGLTSKQIGLCGEVLEQLIKSDHDIRVVRCGGVLQNCYFNRSHNIFACASCQSRENKILELTQLDHNQIFTIKNEDLDELNIPHFSNLSELQSFSFKNINIGRGVASSIISHTRDFEINSSKYHLIIENELRKAANVTLYFANLIQSWQPDVIYLFNGRFAEVYPLLELAKNFSIPYYCIEAGAGENYHLFKNSLPHSIKGRTNIMNEIWEKHNPMQRDQAAKAYYITKRTGSEQYEKSYTNKQIKNLLPGDFNSSKINVAIFNSSEDEVKTIDEWQHNLYATQNDAIKRLCEQLKEHENIHFYLRVHPNLTNVDNSQLKGINSMDYSNLSIIAPDSRISSYALMEACDKILTFGSTMGIEATFWGKPSILYGKSYYMYTQATYLPNDLDELLSLIKNSSLQPKLKQTTYPYGLFLTSYGKPAQHFKHNGKTDSVFKNHTIKSFYWTSPLYILKFLKYFSHWKNLHKEYFGSLTWKNILRYK